MVFLLCGYTHTHYKMNIFYLRIIFFGVQIERHYSLSFWNTSKYAGATTKNKNTKRLLFFVPEKCQNSVWVTSLPHPSIESIS
jgi:hypothetical protein